MATKIKEFTLKTFTKDAKFKYHVTDDCIIIKYGSGFKYELSVRMKVYQEFLKAYTKGPILIGATKGPSPAGSMDDWFKKRLKSNSLFACYLAPIMEHRKEGKRVTAMYIN